MPFHDSPLKLVIVFASLLAHHVLVVRCASLGAVRNATIPPALVLSNPSAPDSSSHGQSTTIDLMDESKLPFLTDCKIDSGSIKICEVYRNLVAVLSERKRDPVTATDVNTIIAEEMDAERFCTDDLSPLFHVMIQKHAKRFGNYHLENYRICEKWCVPVDDDTLSMHVKPICKVLLWGFKKELQPNVQAEDPVKQAAKAVMPPLVPIAGGQIEENDHAETNPAQPVAAAQPNITLPENTAKAAAPPKKTETDRAKVSSDDTAAVAPPAVNADLSASQTTATGIPTKPVTPPGVSNPVEGDDDQDPNELQNQENLKGMNGDGLSNVQEDGDPDDDSMLDDPQPDDAQETSENVQPKLEDEPFGVKKTEDQKADSSSGVQVERVEQEDPFFDPDDSNFFSYFLFMMFMCILCYVAYHNKSKLLALLLEGRRTNSGRGGFNKGRKHTAAYRKLDSNLEEAITSNAAPGSRSTSQIIY